MNDMLFASIVSVICGFNSYRCFERFVGINLAWLRRRGCAFANGVPDSNSFQYLFAHLDPGLLGACLRSVAGKLRERTDMEIVSFDGRSAFFRMCKFASVQAGSMWFSVSSTSSAHVRPMAPVLALTNANCPLAHLQTCTLGEESHDTVNRATVLRIAVNVLNRYGRSHDCGTKMARMMANQSEEALEEMIAC